MMSRTLGLSSVSNERFGDANDLRNGSVRSAARAAAGKEMSIEMARGMAMHSGIFECKIVPSVLIKHREAVGTPIAKRVSQSILSQGLTHGFR